MKVKVRRFDKEVIHRDMSLIYQNPNMIKEFVKSHRNVFSDYTRRYLVKFNNGIFGIKEIDRFGDNVQTWVWVFFKDGYIIYKFNGYIDKLELKNVEADLNDMLKNNQKEV